MFLRLICQFLEVVKVNLGKKFEGKDNEPEGLSHRRHFMHKLQEKKVEAFVSIAEKMTFPLTLLVS